MGVWGEAGPAMVDASVMEGVGLILEEEEGA